MVEKSSKSHVEVSAEDDENALATRKRSLPSYLTNYVDVPGQNKLQTL